MIIDNGILYLDNNSVNMDNAITLGRAHNPNYYQIGDKIGQLVIQQKLVIDDFEIVEDLNDTNRGNGGFGSTGK